MLMLHLSHVGQKRLSWLQREKPDYFSSHLTDFFFLCIQTLVYFPHSFPSVYRKLRFVINNILNNYLTHFLAC